MPRQLQVALGALLLAAVAWWFLHESPEDQVRDAHLSLAAVLSKSGEDDGLSVLQIASLDSKFADQVIVVWDASEFSQSYSPQEIASQIVQIRAAFESIELVLGEIAVELPESRSAIARFEAELNGVDMSGERVREVLSFESRMQFAHGAWHFSEFVLSDAASVPLPPR